MRTNLSIASFGIVVWSLVFVLYMLGRCAYPAEPRRPGPGNGLTEDDQRRYEKFVGKLDDTPENAILAGGFRAFHDKALSIDYSTSCSSCHDVPNKGGADGRHLALGMIGNASSPAGFEGAINTPSIVNIAAEPGRKFHDRRTANLFSQCILPPADKSEGGLPNIQAGFRQMMADPQYAALLQRGFGSPTMNVDRFATMIVAFEQTLVATDAPVLRYYDFAAGKVKDETAMTDAARRGFDTFMEAGCTACHKPPYFRDGLCHNTGLLFLAGAGERGEAGQQAGGLERGTKTASLLNIGRTPPYGVKGEFKTVLDYVKYLGRGCTGHFQQGGVTVEGTDPLLDPRLGYRRWTGEQMDDLAIFLVEGMACDDYPDDDEKQIERSPTDE